MGAATAAATAATTAATTATAATAMTAMTAATSTASTAVTAALGSLLWPAIGVVVGAVVISSIAQKMSKAGLQKDMWAVYYECETEFKKEVAQIKAEMTEQVLQTVTEIFDREVRSMDNSFRDFRMAVNIDSRNIPLLETKLQAVQNLMEQIEQLKHGKVLWMESEVLSQRTMGGKIENVVEYEAK